MSFKTLIELNLYNNQGDAYESIAAAIRIRNDKVNHFSFHINYRFYFLKTFTICSLKRYMDDTDIEYIARALKENTVSSILF